MHSERATGGAVRTAKEHPGHQPESTERARIELMFQEGVTPPGGHPGEHRGDPGARPAGQPDGGVVTLALASLLNSQGANPYRVRLPARALGLLRLPHEAGQYLNTEGELVLPWLGEAPGASWGSWCARAGCSSRMS